MNACVKTGVRSPPPKQTTTAIQAKKWVQKSELFKCEESSASRDRHKEVATFHSAAAYLCARGASRHKRVIRKRSCHSEGAEEQVGLQGEELRREGRPVRAQRLPQEDDAGEEVCERIASLVRYTGEHAGKAAQRGLYRPVAVPDVLIEPEVRGRGGHRHQRRCHASGITHAREPSGRRGQGETAHWIRGFTATVLMTAQLK